MGIWQYPGEKEITFPPFTCLEADGDARLERDADGKELVVFPLKVAKPLAANWQKERDEQQSVCARENGRER